MLFDGKFSCYISNHTSFIDILSASNTAEISQAKVKFYNDYNKKQKNIILKDIMLYYIQHFVVI